MKIDQNSCKHKYIESKRQDGGYWFRCIYCGKEIFGKVSR